MELACFPAIQRHIQTGSFEILKLSSVSVFFLCPHATDYVCCLSVYLAVYLYIYLYTTVSTYLPTRCLYLCPFVYIPTNLSIYLYCLPNNLPTCLSITCLTVLPTISVTICHYVCGTRHKYLRCIAPTLSCLNWTVLLRVSAAHVINPTPFLSAVTVQ